MADSPSLRKKLAPVYQDLFSDFFDRPEVVETRATCDTCAMCNHGQAVDVPMEYFLPDAKCCTFHPGLANYLVGAILADTTDELAEGRKRLRARIAARIGVTPNMIQAPRKYTLVYTASRDTNVFGRTKSLLCPYYSDDGRCTVWRYRDAVCSTYFCKYTAGKPGWEFWDTMKSYLSLVEHLLAHHAQATVDENVKEPQVDRYALTLEDLEDRAPKDADYASYWGQWVGREEEFYIKCYETIKVLKKETFHRNVDDTPNGRGLLARLEARYDEVGKPIPPASLIRAKKMKMNVGEEKVVMTTYNPYDAFSIERELYDALGELKEDQTLEQNLERLDREHDIQLAPELIQYLYIHGVLTAPDKDKEDVEKLELKKAAYEARQAEVARNLRKAPTPEERGKPPAKDPKKKRR